MQGIMFRKNNPLAAAKFPSKLAVRKEAVPTVISKDMHMLGNIICDGTVDFDGTLEGNIRCVNLTLRSQGAIKGEIIADTLAVYGNIKGLIRAKNIHFYASCHVEGIIMHETIAIEDGAFIDGKFKRSNKLYHGDSEDDDEDEQDGEVKMLENIRLIG